MAISPMMQHYLQTKEKYSDSILFYRLGDFYEMFFEDAKICSRVLGLTLTGKDCGLEERAPMCGIPSKALDTYLPKMIDAGYKVAICEQLSEPKKGVIVERDVVRIVTPGTVIDSSMLDESKNIFIMSCYKEKNNIGVAYIDISTGEFYISEFREEDVMSKLNDILVMVQPKEILCNSQLLDPSKNLFSLNSQIVPSFTHYEDDNFKFSSAQNILLEQLQVSTLKGFNCSNKQYAICSAGALIKYLKDTQKRDLSHINKLEYFDNSQFMQIDANTRRNLELTETIKDRKKRGSLFWVLDKTKTSMGARTLRSFIEKPLYNDKIIAYRLNGVEELVKNIIQRENLKEYLYNIYDLERLCGKISYGNLNPKDCIALLNTLKLLPKIKTELTNFKSPILVDILDSILDYSSIVDLLERAISEDCTASTKDGGFIKKGFNEELDELINISTVGKTWIAELEATEKESTGIKNLKISFNKVFGYFIEVLNSQKELVPFRYQRKQTVANAERYITEELKNIEYKIINAEDKKKVLELEIFTKIRESLLDSIKDMQKTAKNIALLDAILSLATVAIEKNYVKPIINKSTKSIEIVNGRHPVIESIIKEDFVPNDTILNSSDSRTMIITGPNMAGKSTYMRQVAIIVLLAHIGSFVPASSAKIALTDKIFTRIGASDDLLFGQSTFMVEMTEVSNILRNATNNSLIILDEVGRGTSTFDGLSIAWSVMEYISKNLLCKTLFSTHFHELTDLEGFLEGVKNYRVSVKEYNNSIIFLRKIVRGGANKSFGIEVASLAELPKEVVSRAKEILYKLEENELNSNAVMLPTSHSKDTNLEKSPQTMRDKRNINEIITILTDLNPEILTPLNAFDILIQLKNYLKKD